MAYMNKETFEIAHGGVRDGVNIAYAIEADGADGDTVFKIDKNWFQIDEAIALPVQALNRKGYTTEFCCSGHLFGLMDIPAGLYKLKSAAANFHIKTLSNRRSQIIFKEGISLPSLPPGFVVLSPHVLSGTFMVLDTGDVVEVEPPSDLYLHDKRLIINRLYDDNDAYGFLRDNADAMEQLYQWALALPDRPVS